MLRSIYLSCVYLLLLLSFIKFLINAQNTSVWHRRAVNESDPNEDEEGKLFYNTYVQFRFRKNLKHLTQQFPILDKTPPIFSRFDWVLWQQATKTHEKNPRLMLVHVDYVTKKTSEFLLYHIWKLKPLRGTESRVIVFAGGDILASSGLRVLDLLPKLKRFSHIWYEGKNVALSGVKAVPSGLDGWYLLRAGLKNVVNAIKKADKIIPSKKKLACVAFGAVFSKYDEASYRKDLIDLVNNSSWVTRSLWPADKYWSELIHYKFMLAPHGNGMQSAKFWECIMARVIPVTVYTPGFMDLKKMGFPIVLVQEWSDVDDEMLIDWYEEYGAKLDWIKIKSMLKIDNFMKILQGEEY